MSGCLRIFCGSDATARAMNRDDRSLEQMVAIQRPASPCIPLHEAMIMAREGVQRIRCSGGDERRRCAPTQAHASPLY